MHVRQIMTPSPHTIRVDKSAIGVDSIMSWAHVRHVPVVDVDGALVGVVSQRDLLRVAISEIDRDMTDTDRSIALSRVPIRKALSPRVTEISPEAPIEEAARLMYVEKIGCLPVTEGGKLIGIVTEHDLIGLLAGIPFESM